MPPVQYYVSYYAAPNKDLFNDNYKAALATYLIDVAAPTNAPGPTNVAQKIYAERGDSPTAFLLWLATTGVDTDVHLDHIVMLHSISQFASPLGRPTTKRDSMEFTDMGDVVSGTIALENWEPIYLSLLIHSVNVLILAMIDTALEATPLPSYWIRWQTATTVPPPCKCAAPSTCRLRSFQYSWPAG